MAKQKQPPGEPMTLGNMRQLGVSKYAAETEVPWFGSKVVCAKCGARGRHIDVRNDDEAETSRS